MEKSGVMSNGKMLVDRIRRIETIYYTAFDRDIPKEGSQQSHLEPRVSLKIGYLLSKLISYL
jgi:hypothetical protein